MESSQSVSQSGAFRECQISISLCKDVAFRTGMRLCLPCSRSTPVTQGAKGKRRRRRRRRPYSSFDPSFVIIRDQISVT